MRSVRRPSIDSRSVVAAAVTAAVIAVAVALLESGGDHKRPPRVSGNPAEVVASVEAFQRDLATRDFAGICDGLFTSRARKAAGGDNCQSVLAQAAARLHRPAMRITRVFLSRDGQSAEVGVMAAVGGGRPVPDTIRLVRERGRYRIVSAGPAAPRSG